jgi:hypothetical protein
VCHHARRLATAAADIEAIRYLADPRTGPLSSVVARRTHVLTAGRRERHRPRPNTTTPQTLLPNERVRAGPVGSHQKRVVDQQGHAERG